MQINVVSFGYLHGTAPEAHLTVDLRHHFRDPHVSPELRYLTAGDQVVRDTVMATPGITTVIAGIHTAILGYRLGPSSPGEITVAIGCAGGRHRAATVAMAVAEQYETGGDSVTLTHRDLAKDVVQR
ncbi:ATPase [Streptomyces xiamenensis]|uniref:RapZ C-terminal domain-containing protein n=1 Tax=Streptomyces xiamenensis TaxID=408015 RepID=UPI0035DE264F